ncbi:hypothetical protein BJX99DRAFT_123320 [Aspergillus californicus]
MESFKSSCRAQLLLEGHGAPRISHLQRRLKRNLSVSCHIPPLSMSRSRIRGRRRKMSWSTSLPAVEPPGVDQRVVIRPFYHPHPGRYRCDGALTTIEETEDLGTAVLTVALSDDKRSLLTPWTTILASSLRLTRQISSVRPRSPARSLSAVLLGRQFWLPLSRHQ